MSSEIEQVTLAVTAINKVETGLAALRDKYQGVVFEVTTTAGMEAAREARRAVRDPRLEVERIRKAAKAPILALGKQLDSTAARITAELEKIEGPIHGQIQAEEARKEAEKQARIDAEVARVAEIQRRIEGIRAWPVRAATQPSMLVGQMLHNAEAYIIDPAIFEEFTPQATDALTASQAALSQLLTARKAHEAEQDRIKAEREELAKLRAEQADRERLASEAQAKVEADAKAERDRLESIARAEREAQAAKVAEENRIEREKLAAERAENERKAAEARAAQEAEAKRLADEAAVLAAREEALRIANLPKPKPRKAPSGAELVEVLSKHYGVEPRIALGWLLKIDFQQERVA